HPCVGVEGRDPGGPGRPPGGIRRPRRHLVGDDLARHPARGAGRHLWRDGPGPRPGARRDDRGDHDHRQPQPDLSPPFRARLHPRCCHRQRVHRDHRADAQLRPGRAGRCADRRDADREPACPALAPRHPGQPEAVNRRRLAINALARAVVYGTALLALIPLGLVLWYTIVRGLPPVGHLTFFPCRNLEHPPGIPGGGVANGIAGTAIMVGLASILAIPVGVIAGVHLAEYGHGRLAGWIRLASAVLGGTPSIAIGLFGYALFVAPFHHFSALAASVALAVLMLPVVMRTTESAVALIPSGLREAGLAI